MFLVDVCITLSTVLGVLAVSGIVTLAMLVLRAKHKKKFNDKGSPHEFFNYISETHLIQIVLV